jgi:hypothetical protein
MLIAQELDQNDPPTGTDFVHGNLGGGALHAVATNSVNGFYAAADKVLNDAHRANVSNPHGVTYTQVGATPLAHASATTNVHGITDTADLLTTAPCSGCGSTRSSGAASSLRATRSGT